MTWTALLNRLALLAGVMIAFHPAVAAAQPPAPDLTLEQLMEVRVTSASRKNQRAEDVAAAVYVITRRAIRESGLVNLPEILRLAPGVQVAWVNSSLWAVSIRGFNDVYSNKLLVLVDGRSVYTRIFSGVFWDLQDLVIADIERIEVIRGPGGAVWGANAVNGVINVITRSAAATQGLALDASVGTFEQVRAGVRYGGMAGSTAYRVFSQWSGYDQGVQVAAVPFDDRWHSTTGGGRVDWSRGADAVLAQAHFTANTTRPGWKTLPGFDPGIAPVTDGVSQAHEVSALGRWTRTRTAGGRLQVQAYHTTSGRNGALATFSERTTDVDAQYETKAGARHGLVFGGGYRRLAVSFEETFTLHIGPDEANTFSGFVQDEVALRSGLALTLGSRLEHDTFGGWDLSPSARVMWEATPGQRLWGAVSRTRRTPSLIDRDFRLNLAVLPGSGLPVIYGVSNSPEYRSQRLLQTEAGYRVRLGPHGNVEATLFTGAYEGLPTTEPAAPTFSMSPAPAHVLAGFTLANLMHARSSGVEVVAQWAPVPQWQLEASYSGLHVSARVDAASLALTAASTGTNAPQQQWQLRSTATLRPGLQFGGSVARVGELSLLAVPAYTRVDTRIEWRVSHHLTAAAVAQNLTSADHEEFSGAIHYLTSGVPRTARLDLRWAF